MKARGLIALVVVASAACGDASSNADAISCKFEIGEATTATTLGRDVGDQATLNVRAQSARVAVVSVDGRTKLRADVLGAASIQPPNPSLPAGVIYRSETDLSLDDVKAGKKILSGSTSTPDGLLSWSCVWR